MASHVARFRPGYWCFCDPRSEKTWGYNGERPSHLFADGERTKLAPKMLLIIIKHPVFVRVFEHASNRCIDETKERRSWSLFQKRVRHSTHARENDLGRQSTRFSFRSEMWIQNNMSVRIQASSLDLNQEEVTAMAHHRPHVCAVDEHLPNMNSRFVQCMTVCSAAICLFVPWVATYARLEPQKEQVKQPPEPTQQELAVKASQQPGFRSTVDVGRFFKTRLVCDDYGKSTEP